MTSLICLHLSTVHKDKQAFLEQNPRVSLTFNDIRVFPFSHSVLLQALYGMLFNVHKQQILLKWFTESSYIDYLTKSRVKIAIL